MPVIFAELASTYPPAKVRDPNSSIAAANGQYLMISRQTYDAIGGHAKIANDLLEDVAMARLVKSSGGKLWFRYSGDAVSTRMYRSWTQMKEGWTKNLALLFPKPSELAFQRLWQFIFMLIFILVLPRSILNGADWKYFLDKSHPVLLRWDALVVRTVADVLFIWLVVEFVVRMRRSHSGLRVMVLGFFGLPLLSYLLWRSYRAYKNARFDWKDRSYVYSAGEVENLTHGFSRETDAGVWQKIRNWIKNTART
jgi:hypothetical protein